MGGIWLWIVGYAAALLALQALVYYYYLRRDEGTSLTPSTATGERPPSGRHRYPAPTADSPGEQSPSGRRCRHCGAVNDSDSVFRYCRDCGEEIGP